MLAGTVLFSATTYLVMWVGFLLAKNPRLHVPLMAGAMLCDLGMPFYLVATRDWYGRLIVHLEIFSFLVWMHLILLITLYVMYGMQIIAGRKLLKEPGDAQARTEHRGQAWVILTVKALVIVTGALLVEPGSNNMN